MIAAILPAVFICLAAFFKAVTDTLFFHYSTSVFKWMDRRWWDPSESWKYVGFIRFTKYRPDAFHLANSGMIVSLCLAIILHKPLINWALELAIAGTIFNVTFNLFFDKILRK